MEPLEYVYLHANSYLRETAAGRLQQATPNTSDGCQIGRAVALRFGGDLHGLSARLALRGQMRRKSQGSGFIPTSPVGQRLNAADATQQKGAHAFASSRPEAVTAHAKSSAKILDILFVLPYE